MSGTEPRKVDGSAGLILESNILPVSGPNGPWLLPPVSAQVRPSGFTGMLGLGGHYGNRGTRSFHVFAVSFREERNHMLATCGDDTTPNNLVQRMCRNSEGWNDVNTAIIRIILELQHRWRVDSQSG